MLPPTPADLAGAQYVYVRWFQPLVASYEPLVDRRLAESKALSSEWLHSNALRLVAAMQQRTLAWLASLQLQAAEAAGGGALPAAPAVRRPAPIVEELESDEEEEVVVVRETRSRRRAAVPAPKRASSRGGRGEGERAGATARGDAYAVPGDELQSRRSSFSLVGAGCCWGCKGVALSQLAAAMLLLQRSEHGAHLLASRVLSHNLAFVFRLGHNAP